MTLNGCSYADASKLVNAADLVRADPLMTALHFERRFRALIKHVIRGHMQPLGENC